MQGLVKVYGSDTVVDGIDLTIHEGEFIVLLGPSGCGKTTVLRMIAGLEAITAGELRFGGELMNHEPPDRRGVGMVFQNYALYPHMTVAGNLSFGLESRRHRGARRKAKEAERKLVQSMSELLELEHVLDHRPKQLSGGQRQRVALGRALIREPKVFLLDEPLSNLDANLRDRMRMELARLHEQLPITTVYVTHDQGEALTLADRLVVMQGGRIHQVGPPSEVYNCPADTFVAGFIGSPGMNLWTLPGGMDLDGGVTVGRSIRIPRGVSSEFLSRDRVIMGIRPEHLSIVRDVDSNEDLVLISCRVSMVENLGGHILLHATLDADAGSVVAQLDPELRFEKSQRVVLGASLGHLHVFDPETSERVSSSEEFPVRV